ncbi:hypothetical protein [Effusibacillus lacus]|uniref:Uncharacterized protein n=1 Tax=Effusibacillus lacus TaxID=1348429 RepID=A0A292YK32_9BACL|nr:hypothetical protein [Effusibacillus lacus]TCS75165.1 hypothetical protein EDD64_10994 [Effusibacillus lacus]GAX89113.1 hypothetical protein EFBL_0731 [Effusibacillus lacus]
MRKTALLLTATGLLLTGCFSKPSETAQPAQTQTQANPQQSNTQPQKEPTKNEQQPAQPAPGKPKEEKAVKSEVELQKTAEATLIKMSKVYARGNYDEIIKMNREVFLEPEKHDPPEDMKQSMSTKAALDTAVKFENSKVTIKDDSTFVFETKLREGLMQSGKQIGEQVSQQKVTFVWDAKSNTYKIAQIEARYENSDHGTP